MVLIFLPLILYLIEVYTVYSASVLAASSVLRSLFGVGKLGQFSVIGERYRQSSEPYNTAFPLFTTYMYRNLGVHWASAVNNFQH